MPHRTYGLLLALLGLAAVASLLLVGADVWLAAGRGPRWKRALLGAGLALAGWLGLVSCGPRPPLRDAEAPAKPSPSAGLAIPAGSDVNHPAFEPFPLAVGDEPKGGDEEKAPADGAKPGGRDNRLAASPSWNRFAALLAEAKEIAAGKRGEFPYHETEKNRLLEALRAAPDLLRALRADGLLSSAEETMLAGEIAGVAARVNEFRPVELRQATCYEPVDPPEPFRVSLDTLRQRLELLEQIAAQEQLSAKVVRKVLVAVEGHLSTLSEGLQKNPAPDGKDPAAPELREKVASLIEKIRAATPTDPAAGPEAPLAGHPAWGRFQEAWKNGTGLIASAKSGTAPTEAERASAVAALAAASGELQALAGDEVLSASEAGLLNLEREGLRGTVRDLPVRSAAPPLPTPPGKTACYAPQPMPLPYVNPALNQMNWLQQRLPLIEGLAASGHVRREVLDKVLAPIEANLALLKKPSLVSKMKEDDRQEAEAMAKTVTRLLEKAKTGK